MRMLISTTITFVLQIVFCGTYLELETEGEDKDSTISVLNIVTLVISVLVLIPVLLIFGFHIYLINKKITTLEYLRKQGIK